MPSFLEDFVAFRRQSVKVAEAVPNALLILKRCFIRYTSIGGSGIMYLEHTVSPSRFVVLSRRRSGTGPKVMRSQIYYQLST